MLPKILSQFSSLENGVTLIWRQLRPLHAIILYTKCGLHWTTVYGEKKSEKLSKYFHYVTSVDMKSIDHSNHSKYIILEGKHGRLLYLIINCCRKRNPRDHEKVLLTRVFISFNKSSVLNRGILVRYMPVLMHMQTRGPWATSLTWENSLNDYIITLIKRRKKTHH